MSTPQKPPGKKLLMLLLLLPPPPSCERLSANPTWKQLLLPQERKHTITLGAMRDASLTLAAAGRALAAAAAARPGSSGPRSVRSATGSTTRNATKCA